MEDHQLVHTFYSAFQQKNFAVMQQCYHQDAVFFDPVFKHLSLPMTRAMWHMLCTQGKDLVLNFEVLNSTDNSVQVKWQANYTFSLTGRRVRNVIHSHITLKDGLIWKHQDNFSLYRWCIMAFGLSGILLGFTPFLQNKIHRTALRNLSKFMEKNRY
jgi:ketosteroid isomerase-like protein